MALCPQATQSVYLLNGIRTEISVAKFSDTILVSLTQIDKIGTILQARQPPNILGDNEVTPQIDTILGKDDTPTHLFARALVEHIPRQFSLILFLGLKSHIPKDIHPVVRMLRENVVW